MANEMMSHLPPLIQGLRIDYAPHGSAHCEKPPQEFLQPQPQSNEDPQPQSNEDPQPQSNAVEEIFHQSNENDYHNHYALYSLMEKRQQKFKMKGFMVKVLPVKEIVKWISTGLPEIEIGHEEISTNYSKRGRLSDGTWISIVISEVSN
jgi:hypothetical protein